MNIYEAHYQAATLENHKMARSHGIDRKKFGEGKGNHEPHKLRNRKAIECHRTYRINQRESTKKGTDSSKSREVTEITEEIKQRQLQRGKCIRCNALEHTCLRATHSDMEWYEVMATDGDMQSLFKLISWSCAGEEWWTCWPSTRAHTSYWHLQSLWTPCLEPSTAFQQVWISLSEATSLCL